MKNILKEKDGEKIIQRINTLSPDSKAQWGTMSCPDMVCHLIDSIAWAAGEKKFETKKLAGPPMILRKLILHFLPWPKGKVKTAPQLLETQPDLFRQDLDILITLLKKFQNLPHTASMPLHPFFGMLTLKEWGRLVWRHCNHHLTQFGK